MSKRRLGVLLGVCVCVGLVTQYLTINVSASVPRGVYWHPASAVSLTRGMLVLVPRTTIGRTWWQFPWMLMRPLKPVAGIAGDRVCVQPEGVWVNDEPYGAVHTAWRGRSLPVIWGCHVVQAGEVFVASKVPGSLDGRYLGMTRISDTTVVVPFWLWD
jgi:type IV secretory pathway protease TraF